MNFILNPEKSEMLHCSLTSVPLCKFLIRTDTEITEKAQRTTEVVFIQIVLTDIFNQFVFLFDSLCVSKTPVIA